MQIQPEAHAYIISIIVGWILKLHYAHFVNNAQTTTPFCFSFFTSHNIHLSVPTLYIVKVIDISILKRICVTSRWQGCAINYKSSGSFLYVGQYRNFWTYSFFYKLQHAAVQQYKATAF